MPGKQAKVLSTANIEELLTYSRNSRYPERNKVMVLLSAKAGLRAGEIANLTWDMVLDPSGEIGQVIELRDKAAKKRSGRLIPLHSDLRQALRALREMTSGTGHVIRSERGGPMKALSVVI